MNTENRDMRFIATTENNEIFSMLSDCMNEDVANEILMFNHDTHPFAKKINEINDKTKAIVSHGCALFNAQMGNTTPDQEQEWVDFIETDKAYVHAHPQANKRPLFTSRRGNQLPHRFKFKNMKLENDLEGYRKMCADPDPMVRHEARKALKRWKEEYDSVNGIEFRSCIKRLIDEGFRNADTGCRNAIRLQYAIDNKRIKKFFAWRNEYGNDKGWRVANRRIWGEIWSLNPKAGGKATTDPMRMYELMKI